MFVRPSLKSVGQAAALAAAGLLLAPAAASAQTYSYQGVPQPYADRYSSANDGHEASSGHQYRQDGGPSPYGYAPQYDGYAPHYGASYDRPTDGYGDYACRSERRQRQGAGVAVGASFGAVLGSQFAARGRRTEGSVLGALVGAAIGGAIGGDSARSCNTGYGRESQYGYADRTYSDQDSTPEQGYGGQSHDDDADRAYTEDRGYGEQGGYDTGRDYDDDRYRSQSGEGHPSDCRPLAVESRDVYGRTVTRYQQTC